MKLLCEVLEVLESRYYRFVKKIDRPNKDETLSVATRSILDEDIYNDNHGVSRMQLALK